MDIGSEQDELEDAVIRRVTLARIRELLSTLPKRERLVLEMRYGMLDGRAHPQHEVAKRLGISRSVCIAPPLLETMPEGRECAFGH